MLTRDWISAAEAQGWRVAGVEAGAIRLSCSRQGCHGAIRLPLASLGPVPSPCARSHTGQYASPVMDGYKDLVGELRRRRRSLGMDQTDVDAAAGLADGHIAKLESLAKIAAPPTLLLWAQTLGLHITVTPSPLPRATIAAIDRRGSRPYAPHQVRHQGKLWAD